jgi:hypothetical protein
MTIDEVIATVKNAQTAAPLTSQDAKLLVAEIERLRRIVGEFRAGLQSIAENPDWHDHRTGRPRSWPRRCWAM